MSFDSETRQHLAKLAEARAAGKVDEAAMAVCDALNATSDAYTTSSCAGRIQLLVLPALGDKAGSIVLGRWHEPPRVPMAIAALGARPEDVPGDAWLMAEPPIFHVEARDLREAERLRALAESCGFKRSVLRRAREDGGVLVEWASTERLETPVMDEDFLEWAWPRAVATFERGRIKLERLERALGVSEDR